MAETMSGGLGPIAYRAFLNKPGERFDPDLALENVTRAAAAIGLVSILAHREDRYIDEGFSWREERVADLNDLGFETEGTIRDISYNFPYSFYKFAARGVAHKFIRNEDLPEGYLKDFSSTFASDSLFRGLDNAARGVYQTTKDLVEKGIKKENTDEILRLFATPLELYASGFTRFADPVNQIAALSRGEDYIEIDRNQGSRLLNRSLRYVDQIMPLLLTPGKEVNQFSESALGEALKGTTTGDVIGIKDPSTVRKTRGTRSEGDPIRGGKLFGLREVSTSTSIEKLFNQAGRPTWDLGIKSSPEAVAVFNKQIFPILNFEAEKIIESGVWDELSIEGKNK